MSLHFFAQQPLPNVVHGNKTEIKRCFQARHTFISFAVLQGNCTASHVYSSAHAHVSKTPQGTFNICMTVLCKYICFEHPYNPGMTHGAQ